MVFLIKLHPRVPVFVCNSQIHGSNIKNVQNCKNSIHIYVSTHNQVIKSESMEFWKNGLFHSIEVLYFYVKLTNLIPNLALQALIV